MGWISCGGNSVRRENCRLRWPPQVLINILNNATKFTGEGGKVTLSASQRSKMKNDAVLRFIIYDTGIGMSEEFLPHIFEPFTQESIGTTALYGGTGLGMAISKRKYLLTERNRKKSDSLGGRRE